MSWQATELLMENHWVNNGKPLNIHDIKQLPPTPTTTLMMMVTVMMTMIGDDGDDGDGDDDDKNLHENME